MNKLVCYYTNKLSVIALIFTSILIVSGCYNSKKASPPKPVVSVLKLTAINTPVTKEYIGITQSMSSVDIRARVKGFLIKMNFIEGKPVKKNELLFMIDPKPFEAKLSFAKGQLSKAIANRDYQRVQYLRLKDLVAKGDVSKSNFDQISAKYGEAIADVEVATAQVQQAQINLGYCSMYSPDDGIISHKYVDVGNLVGGTENTLLANVVTLNPLYVEFSPSVNDFGDFLNYRANMPFKVEIRLPQNDKDVFSGHMDLVNNQADIPTSTILMRAIIDNANNTLIPGVYVAVKIVLTDKHVAIQIPIKAVMDIQGRRTVYVVDKQNQIQSRVITTSGQHNQNYVIASGLQEGEMIITSGLQKLRPGEEVTPNIINK